MHFVHNGGEATKVEPFTMVREYPVQWVRVKTDLGKIKDFRAKGWSFGQIAKHVGRSKATIIQRLQRAGSEEERLEQ